MDLRFILNTENHVDAACDAHAANVSRDGKNTNLRTGKWSEEEEQFATALIKHFVAGALYIPTGTSLRSFLATKLHCSAMRVSTKLSMDALGTMKIPKKLGQKRFFPMEGLSATHRQRVADELKYLESVFRFKENLVGEVDGHSFDVRSPRGDDAMSSNSNSNNNKNNNNSYHSHDASSTSSDEERDGPMRVGSWSQEEQEYACALIDAFLNGVVNVSEGTSLRLFLADRLCCNPMRVSKKLATGKMAEMVLPKRLGSATYRRRVGGEFGEISRTEMRLDRYRVMCFATFSRPSLGSTSVLVHHASPLSVYLSPSVSKSASTVSPLNSSAKRKLPSSMVAEPMLPLPLMKKARFSESWRSFEAVSFN